MTPYLTCDAAIELLEGFVDGELSVADQVAVESHLRWCRVCEARVDDMQLVGASLRSVCRASTTGAVDQRDLDIVQSGVLARVRAEREQSVATWFRSLFVDQRLLWPALGATAAVMTCLFAATGVFAAATVEDQPNSMAGLIDMLANPGSDQNPMHLDGSLSAPRAIDAGRVLDSINDADAVYALSAVVTREGRVSTYELLLSERDSVRRRETAAENDDQAAALMAAVKGLRFEPAQTRSGGAVAVNVVWLLTRTTVKGSAQLKLELPQALVAPGRVPVRPETPEVPVEQELVAPSVPSPTA